MEAFNAVVNFLRQLRSSIRKSPKRIPFLLLVVSIVILLLVLFLVRRFDVEPLDLRVMQPIPLWMPASTQSVLTSAEVCRFWQSPVIPFWLTSKDNNAKRYLEVCLRIATDLKRAGVKAVLIDVRYLWFGPEEIALLRKLQETGIVVVGMDNDVRADLDTLFRQSTELSRARYLLKRDWLFRPLAYRIAPLEERNRAVRAGDHFVIEYGFGYPDVTLELLRKYHGIPAHVRPEIQGSELSFGEYTIPLTKSNHFLVRAGHERPLTAYFGAKYESESDSLTFYHPMKLISSPLELAESLRGKVVLIGWSFSGRDLSQVLHELKSYSDALVGLINKKVVTAEPLIGIALVVLSLGICIFLSLKLRWYFAAILIFALSRGLVFGGRWLLEEHSLIVGVSYAVIFTFFAAFILPISRRALEVRQPQQGGIAPQ